MRIKITLTLLLAVVFTHLSTASATEASLRRIVSLSPNLTQVIFALGEGDRVVGVTIYSEFPPESKDLPKVGGWINPNYEAILALEPDLVVMMKDQDVSFGDKIRSLGLKTFTANSNDSVEDILQSITDLGEMLGKESEARGLNGQIQSTIREVVEKTGKSEKKSVLLVVGRNPGTLEDIYAIGTNNYINELITVAGGKNVITHERNALKITREAVYSLNPEVIIEINHEKIDKEAEILAIWDSLEDVSAVMNNRVYVLSSALILHPSQRITEGVRVLARTIHPELY